jgi:hypothetical protein
MMTVGQRRLLAVGAASCLLHLCGLPVRAQQRFVPTPPVEATYMLNCMGCHLADGSGASGKVPSLRDSLVPLAMSNAGRHYLVQVPGVARSALSDEDLARLLAWMVRNLSARPVPAAFRDFTPREIARYRSTPLIAVRERRALLLGGSRRELPRRDQPAAPSGRTPRPAACSASERCFR